jgi:hypothetical protein
MTLGKQFDTGGASRLRAEVAFSNLFNIENWDIPNMTVTSSAFGRITSTQSVDQAGPRTIPILNAVLVLGQRTRRAGLHGPPAVRRRSGHPERESRGGAA